VLNGRLVPGFSNADEDGHTSLNRFLKTFILTVLLRCNGIRTQCLNMSLRSNGMKSIGSFDTGKLELPAALGKLSAGVKLYLFRWQEQRECAPY